METVTPQTCNNAEGHWYECGHCNHTDTAPILPVLIEKRHDHYRKFHPEEWVKL